MTEQEFEGSRNEEAAPAEPVTQPIALPSETPLAPPRAEAGPPTATYALGALAGNPDLGPPAPAVAAAPPASPPPPPPPVGVSYSSFGWPQSPPPAPAPPSNAKGHGGRPALAVGAAAALVLVLASVAIGHATWKNPTPISSAQSSGSAGTGSNSGSGSATNPSNGFGGSFPGYSSGGNFNGGFGTGNSNSSGSSTGTGPKDAASIASKVDPGLVDIDTTLGYAQEQAAGTGIVLTSNGEILTNNHVVEGATSISVTDVGNHKTYNASVVGYDRSQDVAVIQLTNASGLTTANIASSPNVSIGQQVVGVGNAGGTGGTPSYAGGTVTALNQSITASDQGDGTSEQLTGLIETNADIQPGDSGGSLVNSSGQVIGMDTAASAGFSFQSQGGLDNQGYSIPITQAVSIAKQIVAGNVSSTVHVGPTAFLGVDVESETSNQGQGGFGFGQAQQVPGALIVLAVTGSPAQEAGLAQGDVITAVNGKSVGSSEALTDALDTYHPGTKVTIAWTDTSGATHSSSVQLSSGPPQ